MLRGSVAAPELGEHPSRDDRISNSIQAHEQSCWRERDRLDFRGRRQKGFSLRVINELRTRNGRCDPQADRGLVVVPQRIDAAGLVAMERLPAQTVNDLAVALEQFERGRLIRLVARELSLVAREAHRVAVVALLPSIGMKKRVGTANASWRDKTRLSQ